MVCMHVASEKRLRWFYLILFALVVGLVPTVRATHIIGGDLSMQATGTKPGLFRLQLNQYWDETQTGAGNRDASVTLLIFRKNNPVLIERITLALQETLPLTFENAACATLRKLSFTQARYYDTHQFDPAKYDDPGGYYIVWERCCRNDALTNVNSAVAAGLAMTFYLEFPPMLKSGVTFRNSSPDFRLPNGSYICINKLFTFDVGATDADGDQLRYSLVTPLNGYTTRTAPTLTNESPRSSYPTINWGSGYSLANVIPGNPALQIDAATGVLTVRASTEGLYLFSVQCEEYRNGVLVGVVRRDFQLPVVDCSKNTPPPAVVLTNGKIVADLAWCGSQPLVLSADKNPAWAYQWQKDGENVRGATNDTLRVLESGMYRVVKSLAKTCANDTSSQAVKVTFVTAPPVKLTVANAKPYCAGDTLTLKAEGQPGYQYRWQKDGNDIVGQQLATLQTYQSGLYTVLAKPTLAVCEGQDTVRVVINNRPTVQIKPSSLSFCPDASVQLTADNTTGYRYQWQQNGLRRTDSTAQITARLAGTYLVTVTAPTGCTATSAPVVLTQNARPAVQLDSIPPLCISTGTVVTLAGKPVGGTYVGIGVNNNQFDPKTAGVGRHQITYTVTSDEGCQAEQNRWIEVAAGPNLTGQTNYYLVKGNSVQLLTQTDQPIGNYRWGPPTALDRTDVASPVANPEQTTPYALTAISAAGCVATLNVLVEVTEPLYIPAAFSPNGDGLNDAWILPNVSAFPNCEVSIFNRWGEVVFFSNGYAQPWRGLYHDVPVLPGLYTYQIKTNNGPLSTTYRGQLMVIR